MDTETLVNFIILVSTWSITRAGDYSPDKQSPRPNLYPPEKVPWLSWVNHISNVHLTDMSAELVRDATYKLEIAYKIQKKYRSGFEFQAGIIVNNLHNYFDRMLLLYRDYSNLTIWRNRARNTTVFINGFYQLQGLYNKIRFEKSIFSALVRKKQKDTEAIMKILKVQHPDHPILHGNEPPNFEKGRRMQNLTQRRGYEGETPDVGANTELDLSDVKPGYTHKKAGYSDINKKPGYSDISMKPGEKYIKPGFSDINTKPGKTYIKPGYSDEKPGYSDINKPGDTYLKPEIPRDFVRPRISLGGRYSGPYQGLPVARATKRTTKKRLWQYKRPLY